MRRCNNEHLGEELGRVDAVLGTIGGMRSRDQRDLHAASFDRAADVYDAARPSYPADAVSWLTEGVEGPILDLGAGTGKLTRQLVGHFTLEARSLRFGHLAELAVQGVTYRFAAMMQFPPFSVVF